MHVVIILLILFILLYCFAIFPEMSRQKRMKAFHGIMFAHRGLHSKTHGIPENSMSAFRAAIQKNYGIELDLHLTRDGELVVFHDDDLKRVCGRLQRRAIETVSALLLRTAGTSGGSDCCGADKMYASWYERTYPAVSRCAGTRK